jgi:hypothetical protein
MLSLSCIDQGASASAGVVQPRASHFVTFGMYVARRIYAILHEVRKS